MKWPRFFTKLGRSAIGGAVVIGLLTGLSHTCLGLEIPKQAADALIEARSLMSPNATVLFGVLALVLFHFLLMGSSLLNILSTWVISPAADFCKDACCIGVGVCLSFGLSTGDEWVAGFLLGLGQAVILSFAASILHLAGEIIRQYREADAYREYIPRWYRIGVPLSALAALLLIAMNI